MRTIAIAHLDKARPVVILTRPAALGHMTGITVAPITSTIRGLSTEVAVGPRNGLDHDCVISCDNITTVAGTTLGDTIGMLFDDQEPLLARAIADAFDLDVNSTPPDAER
jgi:mRNA interferase MazF